MGAGLEDETAAQDALLARIDAAHEALLQSRDLQLTFSTPKTPPPPPDWLESLVEMLRAVAPAMGVVLWSALIALAALVAWLVLREFVSLPGGRRKTRKDAPAVLRPEAAAAQALLEDADRLAAERRFAEAVHVLLFRSVDDINSRRPGLVQPALTGRDISGLPAIPEEPRDAFSRIVQTVELSLFGAREVDEETFRQRRRDYQIFAFSEAWR